MANLTKASLRKTARENLRALAVTEIAQKSAAICASLAALPRWRSARVVGLFAAQPVEPALEILWKNPAKKTFCFPRMHGVDLEFYAVSDPAELEKSRWQLREPRHDPANVVAPQHLELLLVPGLAFTRGGARLGRGGGFYDRFLARLSPGVFKIGVCFDVQILPELPRETHDCAVDFVVTETLPPKP